MKLEIMGFEKEAKKCREPDELDRQKKMQSIQRISNLKMKVYLKFQVRKQWQIRSKSEN